MAEPKRKLLKNKFSSYLCFLSHKQHRSIKLWSGWLALKAGSPSHEHQPLILMSPWRSNFHSPRNYEGRITAVLFPDYDSAVSWSRQRCFLIRTVLFPDHDSAVRTVLFLVHDSVVSWSRQCCFQITTALFPDQNIAVSWSHQCCFLITTVMLPDHDSSAVSWSRKCHLLILFSDHCNSVSRTRRCYFRVREEVLSDPTASSYICYYFSGHCQIFRLSTAVQLLLFQMTNRMEELAESTEKRVKSWIVRTVPWNMEN